MIIKTKLVQVPRTQIDRIGFGTPSGLQPLSSKQSAPHISASGTIVP